MTPSLILSLPVLIPLLTAIIAFAVRKLPRCVTILSITGAAATLVATIMILQETTEGGIHAVTFGNWVAPFGIVFVADLLSASMVTVSAIIGLATTLYATADLRQKPSYGLYHVLMHMLLAGVNGAFLTGDLFNLYVWFEVMLITSSALMVLDGSKEQIDAAIKYVSLNFISTLFFLLGIGLVYGTTGTLNLAHLHEQMAYVPFHIKTGLSYIFLFAFAIKAGLFPLFAWLPASYHTLPNAILALFAGLLTKVGVYALIRIFTLVFPVDLLGWQTLLIWVAGLTMITGVLGAASQFTIKRILSFHIISQIGYMIMGLAIYTKLAIAGAIFYIIHHIIVKANLCLIGGIIARRHGSDNLKYLGGAYASMPILAMLFAIPALSLVGIPPLSGFWGKLMVIKASLETEAYLLAAAALTTGFLTLFSMSKIWNEAFLKSPDEKITDQPLSSHETILLYLPIILLALLTVTIGLIAEPLFALTQEAAFQLLYPKAYVNAVLGTP